MTVESKIASIWERLMSRYILKLLLMWMLLIAVSFVYKGNAKDDNKTYSYPLPVSVEVLIPRLADIVWHSEITNNDRGQIAVLYSTPIVGYNDSLQYLEFFKLQEDGSVTPRDRIYLGGRGLYVVDNVVESRDSITVHAREHQGDDPMSNPTRRVDIIVKYGRGVISICKRYL